MTDVDWDDERPLADWEDPDGEDDAALDVTPTRACSTCGCDVYDDAEQCPACGEYFTRDDQTTTSFPVWIQVTAIVLLGVLTASIWRAFF